MLYALPISESSAGLWKIHGQESHSSSSAARPANLTGPETAVQFGSSEVIKEKQTTLLGFQPSCEKEASLIFIEH